MTPEHPIILCGFTSSGKTTIGKLLSEQLGLPFYDTDQMLIEHYKMTIPEIFAKGPSGMQPRPVRGLHRRWNADL